MEGREYAERPSARSSGNPLGRGEFKRSAEGPEVAGRTGSKKFSQRQNCAPF